VGLIQPSLRDSSPFSFLPGVKTPGYFQKSLTGLGGLNICVNSRNSPQKTFSVKVEVSAFSLGFQQNLAVVANDEFPLRAGKMAEKMNRQVPTSNLQRDSKLQNAFGALVIGDSLVLGWWVLEVARETRSLPFCHSVKKPGFASLRLRVNPVLKSQIPRKTYGNESRLFDPIRGYFHEKNSQFFYRPIYQNTGLILQKRAKKPCKFTPKTMRFMACLHYALESQNASATCHKNPMLFFPRPTRSLTASKIQKIIIPQVS